MKPYVIFLCAVVFSAALRAQSNAPANSNYTTVLTAARAAIENKLHETQEAYALSRQVANPKLAYLFNFGKFHVPSEVDEIRALIVAVRKNDEAMREVILNAPKMYEAELVARGIAPEPASKLAESYRNEFTTKLAIELAETVRPFEQKYFQALNEILDLAAANFHKWFIVPAPKSGGSSAPATSFKLVNEAANNRYRELVAIVRDVSTQEKAASDAIRNKTMAELNTMKPALEADSSRYTVTQVIVPQGMKVENEEELKRSGTQVIRTAPSTPSTVQAPSPRYSRHVITYQNEDPTAKMLTGGFAEAVAHAPRVWFVRASDSQVEAGTPLYYTQFRISDSAIHFVFPNTEHRPTVLPGSRIYLEKYFAERPLILPFFELKAGVHPMDAFDLELTTKHRALQAEDIQLRTAKEVPNLKANIDGTKGMELTLPLDLPPGEYALVLTPKHDPLGVSMVYDFSISNPKAH